MRSICFVFQVLEVTIFEVIIESTPCGWVPPKPVPKRKLSSLPLGMCGFRGIKWGGVGEDCWVLCFYPG